MPLEAWHDFYLLIGGAATTLVGLLFVGLSQHLSVVIASQDVLRMARLTFLTFLAVALVAACVLIPGQAFRTLGVELLGIGLVGIATVVASYWTGSLTPRRVRASLAKRIGLSGIGFVGMTAVGLALQIGSVAVLGWLAAAVLILVASAYYASWDLLVTLGRTLGHRRQSEAPQATRREGMRR